MCAGIPDLLMLLIQLTQTMMNERLGYLSELQCTVLEVKVVEGHGTTIDVVLVNGILNEGETIVVCGLQGPIVTSIRALLTPPPMMELRIKSEYVHNKSVKAAIGVKISAPGLEQAIAGSQLLVYRPSRGPSLEELKDEVQADLASVLSKVDKSGQGVCVQASTLGSLEALLSFLSDMKVRHTARTRREAVVSLMKSIVRDSARALRCTRPINSGCCNDRTETPITSPPRSTRCTPSPRSPVHLSPRLLLCRFPCPASPSGPCTART